MPTASATRSDELVIHPLAALPLEDLISQAAAGTDSGWRQQLQTIRDSQDFKPDTPLDPAGRVA